MEVKEPEAQAHCLPTAERRRLERRTQVLRALLVGSFKRRRRGPRRADERGLGAVDWHHPQWLLIGVLILVFSCSDAFMTLVLIDHGAYEVNPLMRALLGGSGLAFALVKVCVTAAGVVLLTQASRIRAFGGLPVGILLYSLLAIYGVLIFYEFRLLNAL
ncbi:MAG TPA: DUF5658 family protein [Steroidobacteraceae bacterium]|jgi:hypothetical protein|nr:DUF5658 family protein [Steroidobacteraceae bacterium]